MFDVVLEVELINPTSFDTESMIMAVFWNFIIIFGLLGLHMFSSHLKSSGEYTIAFSLLAPSFVILLADSWKLGFEDGSGSSCRLE